MKYILYRRTGEDDTVVDSSDNTGSLYVTLMDELISMSKGRHEIKIKSKPKVSIDLEVTLTNYDDDYRVTKWVVFEG